MKKLLILATIALAGLSLAACGNNSKEAKDNSSLKAENSSLKKAEAEKIVGSYENNQDGAAITFNSDGTGRYVSSGSVNKDTENQLRWKKNSDGTYKITLQNSHVSSSLTGMLKGTKLTVFGDDNWETERFTRVKGKLNLDKFLANNQGSSSNSSQNSNSNNSNVNPGTTNDGSQQEKPLVKDGQTYRPKYNANGQIDSWQVTGSDGITRTMGDPGPGWQNIESEYNSLNNK